MTDRSGVSSVWRAGDRTATSSAQVGAAQHTVPMVAPMCLSSISVSMSLMSILKQSGERPPP